MEQTVEPRFSCGGCGRTFRWEPGIAGKKAKCACGATVTVPMNEPGGGKPGPKVVMATAGPKRVVPTTNVVRRTVSQPVAPPAVASKAAAVAAPALPLPMPAAAKPAAAVQSGDEDDGAYDIADGDLSQLGSLLPTAEAIAAAEREVPPMLAAQPIPAEPLEYQRPVKMARTRSDRIDPVTGELSDPIRDYIAPAILLAAGLGGIAIYVIQRMGTGPLAGFAISIAFAIMLGITLFKTVVLTMAAVPLATYCDVGIGLLRTAILKIAATILFGDIAIIGLVVILQSAGVISKRGDGGIAFWFIYVVVLAVVYQLCFGYMFRLSGADFRFAALMSFFSRLCNFFMELIALGLIMSLAASFGRPTASANVPAISAPPTISSGTPLMVQPGQNVPTAMDELISQRIKQNPFRILEGYVWCRSGPADDADRKLVSDLYGAGADKVYVDGFTLYALLPSDPAKHSACLDVVHKFRAASGIPDNPAGMSLNYQYAVVDLLGERMKSSHHGN